MILIFLSVFYLYRNQILWRFCSLSDQEIVESAIRQHLFLYYPPKIIFSKGGDFHEVANIVQAYQSAEEFPAQNPDCCKVVPIGEDPAYAFNRGYGSRLVNTKYIVGYFDPQGTMHSRVNLSVVRIPACGLENGL